MTGSNKAAGKLVELLGASSESVQLGAAKDLLDRVGLKAPEKKEISHKIDITTMTADEKMERIDSLLSILKDDE
jgi:hypothetical protein